MSTVIDYSYEVVSVDSGGKSMEVLFRAPGFSDFRAGVPLPSVGETAEEVIKRFVPILEWQDEVRQVEPVTPGLKGGGQVDLDKPTPQNEVQDILAAFPPAHNSSVQELLSEPTEYLRVVPLHNRAANLVGVEVVGPGVQVSVEEGTKMFNSASRVINKAKANGVPVFAFSMQQNVIDFLVNIHGMTRTVLQDGTSMMYTPVTPEMDSAASEQDE